MIYPKVMHESWYTHLEPLFNDPKMSMIKDIILANCDFYPSMQDIFKVFSMPIDSIKVVILGQDPYPNGEAIGLAFATNMDSKLPASLRIIAKEVYKNDETNVIEPKWKLLEHWTQQGVFLLNTALTVEQNNAGSHLGVWQWFTREVIKKISKHNPCIWMLWGAKAQSFKDYIFNNYSWDGALIRTPSTNYILEAPHPAAELYSGKTGKTFTGCNHFVICNEILELKKQQKINF